MSTNPFDNNNTRVSRRSTSRVGASGEPPTWAARNVEWPLPNSLSNAQYARLSKTSKQLAISLGMSPPADTLGTLHMRNSSGTQFTRAGSAKGDDAPATAAGVGLGNADAMSSTSAHQSTPYYAGGLSGFMSRVLNVSNTAGAASDVADHHALDSDASLGAASRPLRPPRQGCVAAANGWIIACLECPTTVAASSATANGNHQMAPPLRLISRWNVRRGHSASMPDQWLVLPPPLRPFTAKVMHVLVDPTASHLVFSASNGECYYIHHSSTSKLPVKLKGFGPNLDGTWPKEAVVQGVQQGLTAGSYVTSIAWDRERGTEGSSKRILLGTSMGEIYEYALMSPDSEDKEDLLPMPVLLHKLYNADTADPSEMGAAVTGLHFERLRTGLMVLAATSGRHKRTRFYTFYSPHNSSFQMVMADQQYTSLTELPGSVDFADLRLCGDHFGLLSESGIYFGTIDRSLSSVNHQSSSGGAVKMIVDSGIIPYGKDDSKICGTVAIPISLAITPHHLITLNGSNEVVFLNRVAQKVIQKERLDASLPSTPTSSLDDNQLGVGELMMDIRRPDQVWLRKGRGLVHMSSSQEDRDVWKFTLQKCLDMPVNIHAEALSPESSPRQLSHSLGRHVSAFESPTEQLSEDERVIENLFEQAKALCSNAAQKAVVTCIRAEYHLSHGRVELAAKYLAQCPPSTEPFADAAIRLGLPKLGIDDPISYNYSSKAKLTLETSNMPLIAYLSDKLRASTVNGDKMTSTMVGAWLAELYLNERGNRVATSTHASQSLKDIEASQRVLLARFLNSNVNVMDSKTIMAVLASHDVDALECAAFAANSGDISTAVNAALSVSSDVAHGVYEALQILDDAPFDLAEALYYKYAPIFLARAPSLASESFVRRYSQGLSPSKLLPALIKYEETRIEKARVKQVVESAQEGAGTQTQAEKCSSAKIVDVQSNNTSDGFELRVHEDVTSVGSFEDAPFAVSGYLEGIIKLGCCSSAVFSYLISLYTKRDDEEPLYEFLSVHVPTTSLENDAAMRAVRAGVLNVSQNVLASPPLDMSFALRTVLKSGRHFRSAILLYKGFGMRQEAVELALKVDPSLARELAQESVELEERRRLWLMIAKSAVADSNSRAGKDVVARVVAVLRDCGPDVLSIEDVLPYMPDFASINQIKDEICEALMAYSSKIDFYLKEMSDCDKICEDLRDEIHRLRNYRMRMRPDARCAYTNKLVLNSNEPFYVFPSGFVVLDKALKEQILPHLNAEQRGRVFQIEQLLSSRPESLTSTDGDDLQAELDGLIAAECPLTGSVMIESIDCEFEDGVELWEKTSVDK
ncbi:hypothetical protein MPSEU_000083500 [Mayamaea pseudoterrestris]|nr:hypothetical protein MPSEU_000083500 [Mayamaea pseudoterrestris]